MSQSIGDLIRRNYIRSALVPIFVIEVMLVVLYFTINAYITDKFSALTLKESQDNLQEVIRSKALNINLQLQEISRSLQTLRDEQQAVLGSQPRDNNAVFALTEGGAWVKQQNNGGSAVIVSSRQELTEEIRQRVRHSEDFDLLFKSVTEHNPRVVATYFISRYHMTRYYPYFDGIEQVLPQDYDINNYNFYYEAKPENNPQRDVVWTGAYLDPAGKGWMISGLIPVYQGDVFEGTTGIDVTIDSLVSKLLDLKLPYQAAAFLLDAEGSVLAMPEQVERVFDLKELKSHNYSGSIEGDVMKPEDFNLLKHRNSDIQTAAQALLQDGQNQVYFRKYGQGYYLYKSSVALTGWHLAVLVPEAAIRGAVRELEEISNTVGYLAVAGMVLFYLVFFVYLFGNARKTAADLARPVIALANRTTQLGKHMNHEELPLVGITELDQLASCFNGMSGELTTRTEQLVQSEIQRREHQNRANTDYLTGLFNRRYFMERVQQCWQKECSAAVEDALIELDIDHFKQINDLYGHDIGDQVLTGLAKVLQEVVGDKALLARTGGEEFTVHYQGAYLQAMELAESLRQAVEAAIFSDHQLKLTISAGFYCGTDLNFRAGYLLADKALYAAKNSGRNRVVASDTLFCEADE